MRSTLHLDNKSTSFWIKQTAGTKYLSWMWILLSSDLSVVEIILSASLCYLANIWVSTTCQRWFNIGDNKTCLYWVFIMYQVAFWTLYVSYVNLTMIVCVRCHYCLHLPCEECVVGSLFLRTHTAPWDANQSNFGARALTQYACPASSMGGIMIQAPVLRFD